MQKQAVSCSVLNRRSEEHVEAQTPCRESTPMLECCTQRRLVYERSVHWSKVEPKGPADERLVLLQKDQCLCCDDSAARRFHFDFS